MQGTPEQRKLEVMLGDAIKVSFAPVPKAGSCRHCGTLWWIAGGPACRELGFANSETQVEWVPFDVLISNTPYQASHSKSCHMDHRANPLLDFVASRFQDARHAQATATSDSYVPAGVRSETGCQAWRQALRKIERQRQFLGYMLQRGG